MAKTNKNGGHKFAGQAFEDAVQMILQYLKWTVLFIRLKKDWSDWDEEMV